ncbi:unnamed protein product, partial [Prorocentrum cordatum]
HANPMACEFGEQCEPSQAFQAPLGRSAPTGKALPTFPVASWCWCRLFVPYNITNPTTAPRPPLERRPPWARVFPLLSLLARERPPGSLLACAFCFLLSLLPAARADPAVPRELAAVSRCRARRAREAQAPTGGRASEQSGRGRSTAWTRWRLPGARTPAALSDSLIRGLSSPASLRHVCLSLRRSEARRLPGGACCLCGRSGPGRCAVEAAGRPCALLSHCGACGRCNRSRAAAAAAAPCAGALAACRRRRV